MDEAYLEELRETYPRLKLVEKRQDRFSRVVDAALRVVTFGSQRRYLTHYVTTIGATLYFPTTWAERSPESRYVTLRHEAVHLAQFRRYGLVGAALLYLLPVFPLGLAWGRARMEWEAYAETFRATAEVYGAHAAHAGALREHVRRQFVSGAYGWMWPFPSQVDRWIDEVLAEIDEAD